MPTLHAFLGAEQLDEGRWRFSPGSDVYGAFGGVFGGIVASCTLVAARAAAPGRLPNALDIRFVRGLVEGGAIATATVLASGRSLTNVAVDLVDAQDRLCARSTISLVDTAVLEPFERSTAEPTSWTPYAEARSFPPVAPIVSMIDPRFVGQRDETFALEVTIPWDDDGHDAEASCVAGDMAVGPPLGFGAPSGVGTPNPDLSLRFCGPVRTPTAVGLGRWQRSWGGVAAVGVEVWSDDALAAIGVSTALLLPPRG